MLSGPCRLAGATAVLLASGCLFRKDPVRAPWLYSGVYAPVQLAAGPAATAPASVAVESVPPIDSDATVEVDGAGRLLARSFAPGARDGERIYVPAAASRPVRALPAAGAALSVPGFLYGVDLRSYRSIAFVFDTGGWLCEGYHDDGWQPGPPAPLVAAAADQLAAAIDGLAPEQSFVIIAGANARLARYAPRSFAGRQLAAEWLRGQVCAGLRSPTPLLRAAFAERPDVVVLVSDGSPPRPDDRAWLASIEPGGCSTDGDPLACTDPVEALGRTPGRRPVIAISLKPVDSDWMRRLADSTGGAFISVAP